MVISASKEMSQSKYTGPAIVTGIILLPIILFGCTSLNSLLFIAAFFVGMVLLQNYMAGGQYNGDERIPGKTVIVTGANSGIGKETAKELAKRGGRIIIACRDLERAEEAKNEIVQETGSENILCKRLDLASLDSVREFAEDFNKTEERLDILINNAGVMMCPKMQTKDGIEMQIGVNHMGHFLLTNLLLDKLKASAPSRIIIVSSVGHYVGVMHFDDLYLDKDYKSMDAYSQSKLANLLHVRGLVKRLEGTGVTVNGLHPGAVDSNLPRHFTAFNIPILKSLLYPVRSMFFKTTVQGAQTTLRLALDPTLETVTGKYFSDCKEKAPSPRALDDEASDRLWEISEEVTAKKKE